MLVAQTVLRPFKVVVSASGKHKGKAMANAKVRVQCGRAWLEVDVSSVKEAVKALSEYTEVFGEQSCGACQSDQLSYEHRQDNEGHDYYTLKCRACGAQLDFGQHKVGNTLFAKRKDKSGNALGKNGWYKWQDRQPASSGQSSSNYDSGEF